MKLVCTADWHLSGTRPLMRTDSDWIKTQKEHLQAVRNYAKEKGATVLVAGDIYDTSVVPPEVLTAVLDFYMVLPDTVFIAGNHDLRYHTIERMEQSSFGAVRRVTKPFPAWLAASDFGSNHMDNPDAVVAMHHQFSVKAETDIPPMRSAWTAKDWLDSYPKSVKLIVIGDNHTPWTYESPDKRLVVNCGCLIHRTATDTQHPCGFYYVDTDKMQYEYIDLSKWSDGCIDLSYLTKAKEAEIRAASYDGLVSELKGSVGKSYDFPSTLQEYTENNRTALGDAVADFLGEVVDYIKE